MEKNYRTALELLSSIQRVARPVAKSAAATAIKDAQQMPNGKPDVRGTPSIHGMKQWLLRLKYDSSDISKLNIVHVAGTKGKGSTCAFVSSFLGAFGERTGFPRKIGLYTSPHLVRPEERIRINQRPITAEEFGRYVWQVHDRLSETSPLADEPQQPRYLQMLALVSLHAFVQEGVDAAVFETHHGGEFDSTNVLDRPLVSVVTALGMDHVAQLGPTIENIAWHKAGIFKPDAPAFSPIQDEKGPMDVLENRAKEKGTTVEFVGLDPTLPADAIQLKPDVQRMNASVALAATRSFISQKCIDDGKSSGLTQEDIKLGVERFSWPGRFQVIKEPTVSQEGTNHWFLDSAHNEMSITKAADWYIETRKIIGCKQGLPRILLFSQITDQRDGPEVFRKLGKSLQGQGITHLILSTYDLDDVKVSSHKHGEETDVYRAIWESLDTSAHIKFQPNITRALGAIRELSKTNGGVEILVTGSQHLVGGILRLLKAEGTDIS